LPVNFNDFEKLNYFSCKGLCGPELINLALIMHSFQKDSGSWYQYLNEADLKKKINIPENGVYTSYYKNGQKLCAGSFLDGKPNGVWNFWYSNGELCQERFYKNGEADGHWSFYDLNAQGWEAWNKPYEFIFENGKLVRYTIRSFDNISYSPDNCKSSTHQEYVSIVEDYKIVWSTDSTYIIEKMEANIALEDNEWFKIVKGDTLERNYEFWEFNDKRWNYTFQSSCEPESTTYIKKAEGYLNKPADYWVETILSKKDQLLWTKDEIVDLRNCEIRVNTYSNDNSEKEIKLIESRVRTISPEIYQCTD
jgi:hypothetical protein